MRKVRGIRAILISLSALVSLSFADYKQEMMANWNKDVLENARIFYSKENEKVYELAEAFYYYTVEEGIDNIENTYEELGVLAVSLQKQLEIFCLDHNAKYNSAYGLIDKDDLCRVVYKRYGVIDSKTTTKRGPIIINNNLTWLEYFHSLDIWNQIEYTEVREYIDYLKRVAPANKLRGSDGLIQFNRSGEW